MQHTTPPPSAARHVAARRAERNLRHLVPPVVRDIRRARNGPEPVDLVAEARRLAATTRDPALAAGARAIAIELLRRRRQQDLRRKGV